MTLSRPRRREGVPVSVHPKSDEQRARQEGISPPLDEGEDEQT